MKNMSLLCAGMLFACTLSAQPSFQTSLQAGISMPLNSNGINNTHTGTAIHFGNHLDYSFGNNGIRFGLGAYIGYIYSTAIDNKYKQIAAAIAEKYRFNSAQLTFNSASFKSTHILLGPVASFGSDKFNFNIWAKGGYGLNEPSRYAVLYKENGIVNNVYINQAGENKNSLAYNLGAGIRIAISEYVGVQLSAAYFSTQTDQVNYNFDREKGTTPFYFTAANQFIQASAGLQFAIGNPGKKANTAGIRTKYDDADTNPPINARPDQKIKTKSNIKNDRVIHPDEGDPAAYRPDQKIKTKSNIKNDRLANPQENGPEQARINKSKSNVKNNRVMNDVADDADADSLLFTPVKIELRSVIGGGGNRTQLKSVDNYLTGFVYQAQNGAMISQCGSNAMPGDPIPGLDVKLKRLGGTGNDILSARTNKDGSFAFNNIAPGDYSAEAGNAMLNVTVAGENENAFRTLDIMGGSCGNTKENYIINAGDKTYVEVIPAREAGSGMATGKKHVGNVKYEDIKVSMGIGREAGSGMATGKRMHKPYRVADTDFDISTDKIYSNDGKLYAEVIATREAGSGMASGRRSIIVTGDIDGDGAEDYNVIAPRDAASGMATGKRMHKPYTITKEIDAKSFEVVTPRDPASGMPSGKRMHKPFVVTMDDAEEDYDAILSPRDAASGQASGRRQYQPLIVRIYPDENSYEVIEGREAGSGMASGKRMHKPFVITKELDYTGAGDEIATYTIIHRDIAARNVLQADDTSIYKNRESGSGMAAGRRFNKKAEESYQPWNNSDADEGVVNNPLYEQSGNQGINPLFESKSNLRVTGSNGIAHDIFIPENMLIPSAGNTAVTPFTEYELGPIKWMAPESIAAKKGITEKGIKRLAPDKQEANTERKGWDGTVKGGSKGINEAGFITADAVARKGWDGTVKGGSRVESISRIRCADGTCSIEAIVTVDGIEYEAVISGVLKTKHDTVKNSINNVR